MSPSPGPGREGGHRGDHSPGSARPGGGHSHGVAPNADGRRLLVALGLISAFVVGEVAAAVIGGSLALFADAGHMLTDIGALGMSAWAVRLASRPAQGR